MSSGKRGKDAPDKSGELHPTLFSLRLGSFRTPNSNGILLYTIGGPMPVTRKPKAAQTIYRITSTRKLRIPLYLTRVSAGSFSPADDYVEKGLDMNEHLIQHPAATFAFHVSGDSMVGAGIFPGDLLIVDRAVKPVSGSVVVAKLGGDL